MGWMHDMLAVRRTRIRFTAAGTTTCVTFSMLYMLHRELHPAVLARRGRARQRRAARQDAGRRVAEVRDAAHAVRLHVRASRARSCCSWAASSASGASGTTIAASTGTCSTIRRTPALRRYVQDLNWHYQAEPALHEVRLRSGRLPLDRLQRQREQRRLDRALRARSPRFRRDGLQLHAGAARRTTGSACPSRAATPSC